MFRYFKLVTSMAQAIIRDHAVHGGTALDGTLGNGHDTQFLLDHYSKVYAFDIQETAVAPWRDKAPGKLFAIHDSHDRLTRYIDEPLDAVMYNLGFRPGSDRSVVTLPETTVPSLEQALELLRPGGLMTVAVYRGHAQGLAEYTAVSEYLASLDRRRFGVLLQTSHNFSQEAPVLFVVEKANRK